jgi:hypothetical protein
MTVLLNEREPMRARTRALLAVTGLAVMAACATGIAAFAGLLPESKNVAVAVTSTPLIDMQLDAVSNPSHHRVSDSSRRRPQREAA